MFRGARSYRSFFTRSQRRAYSKGSKKQKFNEAPKQNAEPKNLPKNEAPPNRELPPESSWITAEQIYKELSQRRTSLAIALGVGSLVAVHELSKVFLDSRYSLHPEKLREDILDYISFSRLDSRTPAPITDSIKYSFFTSFLSSSPYVHDYLLAPGAAEAICDAYSETDVIVNEPEVGTPASGAKLLRMFPLHDLCTDDSVAQRFIDAGIYAYPLVQRILDQQCDPLVEAFVRESKVLRSLVSGPLGAQSFVRTPEFSVLLPALEVEAARRPYTVSFVLYSLIYYKESRDLLTPGQISIIKSALDSIYQQGRGDGSLTYASLGRKLINGESRPKAAVEPLAVENFDEEHRPSMGVLSRMMFTLMWALPRWTRLGASRGFTAILWPQWSRLMLPKMLQTYFVVQLLSSTGAISSILSPVERKAFGGNSSTRIGASATSAAVNFFAASFLLWRVPFAIMPTLMCFGWDFVYASMLSSNTAIGLQVNQYLDRMPLPYSEADLRKIKEESKKESK